MTAPRCPGSSSTIIRASPNRRSPASKRDAVARFELTDIVIVHRHGALAPGEAIVFVAAAAPHRRAAFDAVDYVMDRLKTEAPFWKREQRSDGAHWLEARDSDREARARWG